MADSELEKILDRINSKSLPPLHLWNPELSGDMDMRIAADGNWYHQGSIIQRKRLVKLFSTILRIEEKDYFLVTPVEKFRIQVDDMPFITTLVDKIDADQQTIMFTTNVDDQVIVNDEHEIRVDIDPVSDEPRPYLHVRDGLYALIHRNAFYQLVEWAVKKKIDGANSLVIDSQGKSFVLGQL